MFSWVHWLDGWTALLTVSAWTASIVSIPTIRCFFRAVPLPFLLTTILDSPLHIGSCTCQFESICFHSHSFVSLRKPFRARPRRPFVSLSSHIGYAFSAVLNLFFCSSQRFDVDVLVFLRPVSFLHPTFSIHRLASNPSANRSRTHASRIRIFHFRLIRPFSQAAKVSSTSCRDQDDFDPHSRSIHGSTNALSTASILGSFRTTTSPRRIPPSSTHVHLLPPFLLPSSTPQPSATKRRCDLHNSSRVTIQMRMNISPRRMNDPVAKPKFIRPPSRVERHNWVTLSPW